MGKNNRSSKKSNRVYVNQEIRANKVRCLDRDNKNIGVIALDKAISLAKDDGLDLIQISSSSNGMPTCRITDYGKYKYDLSKREKELAKKQREAIVKQKEIKFRPCTDTNDLQTKAKMASKFLSEGCRVRVSITFKGREASHQFVAEERFNEFLDFLEVDVNLINEPKMDGKSMIALLGS